MTKKVEADARKGKRVYKTRERSRKDIGEVEKESHRDAVMYVKSERIAQGYPPDSKDELRAIEADRQRNIKLRNEQPNAIPYQYLDTLTFSKKIATDMWADRVARELVDWVEANPSAIKINEFIRLKGIYHRDFFYLASKHERLGQAVEYAKRALGDIRERNILENKWNANAGMYMMNHYDPDWKAETDRRDSVKLQQNQTTTTDLTQILGVVMKPPEITDEVRISLERFKRKVREEDESERLKHTDTEPDISK